MITDCLAWTEGDERQPIAPTTGSAASGAAYNYYTKDTSYDDMNDTSFDGMNDSCLTWFGNMHRRQEIDTFLPSMPTKEPTEQDTNALLNNDMKSLTPEERERTMLEIHGVQTDVQEDPEFIQQCLAEMELELQITTSKQTAYQQALRMSPEYVNDRAFRLKFLRADSFHSQRAAKRLGCFFEEKLMLFGKEKLTKHIQLDDLEDEDIQILESGALAVVQGRDMAGRPIVMGVPHRKPPNTHQWESALRMQYLSLMTLAQDEIAQKKGAVGIYYVVGQGHHANVFKNRRANWNMTRQRAAMPIRFVCNHMCYDDPRLINPLRFLMMAMGPQTRSRIRMHFGSHQEIIYKLMQFGIPAQIMPVDPCGNIDEAAIGYWSREIKRKYFEERAKSTAIPAGSITWTGMNSHHQDLSQSYSVVNEFSKTTNNIEVTTKFDLVPDDLDPGNIVSMEGHELSRNYVVEETSQHVEEAPSDLNMAPDDFDCTYGRTQGVQDQSGDDFDMHMEEYESSETHTNGSIVTDKPANVPTDSSLKIPQHLQESKNSNLLPGDLDCTFGRGRGVQDRPGNVRLRRIIDMHMEEYESSSKYEKTAIAERVVRIVNQSSGRFLKPSSDGKGFEEMDLLSARDKVSRAFRARRAVQVTN